MNLCLHLQVFDFTFLWRMCGHSKEVFKEAYEKIYYIKPADAKFQNIIKCNCSCYIWTFVHAYWSAIFIVYKVRLIMNCQNRIPTGRGYFVLVKTLSIYILFVQPPPHGSPAQPAATFLMGPRHEFTFFFESYPSFLFAMFSCWQSFIVNFKC